MLKIAWSDVYNHPLPEGHRFPMIKYDLIPEQLLYEGSIKAENIFKPVVPTEELILTTHDSNYWYKLKTLRLSASEIRKIGFPLSQKLIEREIIIMNGTVQTALNALQNGISMNVAGGTHHAFTNRGEGFCLLNDMAIAANYILQSGLVKKILIVDLDVHQGNGTAEIFKNNPDVFTFSMHGASNYPAHKEISDLDIALDDKTEDKQYLKVLADTLPGLVEKEKPDFIFYQSGVDVLATDKLGKLSLSKEGCKVRDHYVLTLCKQHNIPISVSMGGGYSEKISDIVDAHCNTFRLAQEIFF